MSEVERVLPVNNKLGEGPVWSSEWTALNEEQKMQQPYAGDLFRVKTDIQGLERPKFIG